MLVRSTNQQKAEKIKVRKRRKNNLFIYIKEFLRENAKCILLIHKSAITIFISDIFNLSLKYICIYYLLIPSLSLSLFIHTQVPIHRSWYKCNFTTLLANFSVEKCKGFLANINYYYFYILQAIICHPSQLSSSHFFSR